MNKSYKAFGIGCLCFFLGLSGVYAQDEIVQFENSEHKALYKKLTQELRCLVCQNQNLADSNADLAIDLKEKTYEMVIQGKSYDEIIKYMTDRYGEFVLYRPRLIPSTLMLWFAPFILFLGVVFFTIRNASRKKAIASQTYSDEQLKQAKQLLDSDS